MQREAEEREQQLQQRRRRRQKAPRLRRRGLCCDPDPCACRRSARSGAASQQLSLLPPLTVGTDHGQLESMLARGEGHGDHPRVSLLPQQPRRGGGVPGAQRGVRADHRQLLPKDEVAIGHHESGAQHGHGAGGLGGGGGARGGWALARHGRGSGRAERGPGGALQGKRGRRRRVEKGAQGVEHAPRFRRRRRRRARALRRLSPGRPWAGRRPGRGPCGPGHVRRCRLRQQGRGCACVQEE